MRTSSAAALLAMSALALAPIASADDQSFLDHLPPGYVNTPAGTLQKGNEICAALRAGNPGAAGSILWGAAVWMYGSQYTTDFVGNAQRELCPDTL